ncbi:chorismate mutase [Cryobacterium sp. HLT2-28]|uniref:chorismate mutase n=1 Tax=Cryobacterium sp. HLT2-28 TaxID=1259146 RepID=UPI00106D398F|nr:chorismate mutase [Cryobacterium sp. HLT2-28]TFB98997.1 chorismate mutase [Cryobacterium sp. HLT2-28]
MAAAEELPAGAGQDAIDELGSIRQSIDNIDAALIHLLAERFKFTQQVGRLKAAHGLPPADPTRELLQIQRLRGLAEEARLDPGFAEKFLNFIIAEVIHHHEKIAGTENVNGGARAAGSAATGSAATGANPT